MARRLPGRLHSEVASQPCPQLLLGGPGCHQDDRDDHDDHEDDNHHGTFDNIFDHSGKGNGKCERGTTWHCPLQGFNHDENDDVYDDIIDDDDVFDDIIDDDVYDDCNHA